MENKEMNTENTMEIEGYAQCEELDVDERCDHDCILFGTYFLSEVD